MRKPFLLLGMTCLLQSSSTLATTQANEGQTVEGAHASPTPASENPYVFVIVHDQGTSARARQFEALLRQDIEPFRSLGNQITFQFVESNQATLNCVGGHDGIARLLSCDTDAIARLGAAQGAHLTMALTSEGTGGAGGTVPVASRDYPLNTLAHEMLHSFGLGDEYPYESAEELRSFCRGLGKPEKYPNVVAFQPAKNPFGSDDEAKRVHSSDVPWSGSIAPSTLITTGNALGATGIAPSCNNQPSVYAAGYCSNVTPSWKPYCQTTIMESLSSNEVPALHQQAILANMSQTLGRPIVPLPVAPAIAPAAASDRKSPNETQATPRESPTPSAPADGAAAR